MDRKEMIKKLGEHLGVKPKYLGVPTFAYQIKTPNEVYTIDRQGDITAQDGETITMEEILTLTRTEEVVDGPEEIVTEENEVNKPEAEELPTDKIMELDGFELKLNMEDQTAISLKNIINMLYSKQHLIAMAFQTDKHYMDDVFAEDLSKESVDDLEGLKNAIQKLGQGRCPGFQIDFHEKTFSFLLLGTEITPEKTAAFKDLCVLIANYSKTLKRASFKKVQEDNPKYALRTWLIRIGMNGPEYKETRKTLLKHLEGSAAFRTVGDEHEA